MQITLRKYQTDEDYWRLRDFLRRTLLANQLHEHSWHVARLDYTRWHIYPNVHSLKMEEVVSFWEKPDGSIVAAMLPDDGYGDAYLQVHPAMRSAELEEELIVAAQRLLSRSDTQGRNRIEIWADSRDALRQELLTRHGFHRLELPNSQAYHRWRCLDAPLPEAPIPPGYVLRPLGDGLELLERCYASGLAFHDNDLHTAVENRDDPAWYRSLQAAPLYRRDLDLVAVTPDGAIAAFCTVWFEDATRSAYIEPVACVPDHQHRGLAEALIVSGLRRVHQMGAVHAAAHTFQPEEHALFASVGFTEYDLHEPWVKEI
jgi:ribosomal protein S18 acetylase RimI-like enzyme